MGIGGIIQSVLSFLVVLCVGRGLWMLGSDDLTDFIVLCVACLGFCFWIASAVIGSMLYSEMDKSYKQCANITLTILVIDWGFFGSLCCFCFCVGAFLEWEGI